MALRFKNPQNGYVETNSSPWLWCLLFGPIYFAVKGIWTHVIAGLLLAALTAGASWFVYPFFAAGILRKHYLRKGWSELADPSVPDRRSYDEIRDATPPAMETRSAPRGQLPACARGRAVFVDIETTGLSADDGDRVIALAALEMIDGEMTGRHLNLIFNPGRLSDAGAQRVHGFSERELRFQPPIAKHLDEIAAFLGDAWLIAHFAEFDAAFLRAEFTRAGRPPPTNPWFCTMVYFREKWPGERSGLDAACRFYNVGEGRGARHMALEDAVCCAGLFQAMVLSRAGRISIEGDGPTNYVTPPLVGTVSPPGTARVVATGLLDPNQAPAACAAIEAAHDAWREPGRKLRRLGVPLSGEEKEAIGVRRNAVLGSDFLAMLTEAGRRDPIHAAELIVAAYDGARASTGASAREPPEE